MDIQAITKAAIVGGIILVGLSFINLAPLVTVVIFIMSFAVYLVVGILAAHWMKKPRDANSGAKNGAVAAVAAALVSILGRIVVFVVTGSSQITHLMDSLPPDQQAAIAGAFENPTLLAGGFGYTGLLGTVVGFCGFWAVIAVIFGAAGGSFWAGGDTQKEMVPSNSVSS